MPEALPVKIRRIENAKDLPLPSYQTQGSSGLDLYAAVTEEVSLAPGEFRLIPTGIIIEPPQGYEAQVRPRSGLALHHGVGILNSPGTIDADYRGEIGVILCNFGKSPFPIKRGDRIAQLVVTKVVKVELKEENKLGTSDRNNGGFGHTGK